MFGLGSSIWEILIIVGPLLLAAVIAWAALHNRQSRREAARGEQATREFYRDVDASDKADGR